MKTHNNKISKIIKIAQKESLRSPHDKFQLGAVLFHQNKIISKAFNNPHKSHPYILSHKEEWRRGIHAEMSAIFKVQHKNNLQGTTMMIFRQCKNGDLANARPCELCLQLIKSFGIKTIVYTTKNGIIKEKINY